MMTFDISNWTKKVEELSKTIFRLLHKVKMTHGRARYNQYRCIC